MPGSMTGTRVTYDAAALADDRPAGMDGANAATGATAVEEIAQAVAETAAKTLLLFKTPTCPNCRAIKAVLDDAGVQYTEVDAYEHPEMAREYGIFQAPTLVEIDGDSFEKYAGQSEIRDWLES